ncbi:MAG: hypothetical protein U9P80_10595, partial [Thermodesulfobacteriota bacterium]|nr:hypothetical protein [Thermodesulfobacteriota bacterium]
MNFKDMKIGQKVVAGFSMVIILATVVVYIGYSGLNTVIDKVEIADSQNRLIKGTLEARRQE